MRRAINSTGAGSRRSRTGAAGLLVVALTIPFASRAVADHQPVHVDVLSRATVDDRIAIKTHSPAEVITYRIELQPGAATPWHYHPGPHLVSIASGVVTVYEADCGTTQYRAGKGFFDPGRTRPAHRQHVHVARNDGDVPAVLLVTDVRSPGAPLRVDVPAPATCF